MATAERLNQQMGAYARAYQLSALAEEKIPPPQEEGELLVVAADGKGVPMRRTLEERLQEQREAAARRAASAEREASTGKGGEVGERSPRTAPREAHQGGAGAGGQQGGRHRRGRKGRQWRPSDAGCSERKGRKQMAYVGAVYTINRFRRTAAEVLDEVARRGREEEGPRPQHKRVWGEMTRLREGECLDGRSLLFAHLAVDCYLRAPKGKKRLICLMDGEEALWRAKQKWLEGGVEILDFFHVLEHLWKVAGQLHAGRAAGAFVEHHARMLLEGKVDYVVRNFATLLRKRGLRGKKAREVRRAMQYFRHNRGRMRYDEYLARGYPIGSAMAEGACRNLVKDRLELTGMKWEYVGAQAMIYTRALYLNGDWDEFVAYRVEKEQEQLYGKGTVYAKMASYAQAV